MANESDDSAPGAHVNAFLTGAVPDALAGAFVGAAAWAVLFGTFSVLSGLPAFLTVVGIGAAVVGIRGGNKAVRNQIAQETHQRRAHAEEQARTPVMPVQNSEQKLDAEAERLNLNTWLEREHQRRGREGEHRHHR